MWLLTFVRDTTNLIEFNEYLNNYSQYHCFNWKNDNVEIKSNTSEN